LRVLRVVAVDDVPTFRRARSLIEPFVFGIEFGNGDVGDFEFADGSVAAAGVDHDGGHGLDGIAFAVELDEPFAFEDQVDLGHLLVIVDLGVLLDFDEMERSDGVVVFHEGAASRAAGARSGVDVAEMGNSESFAHDVGQGLAGFAALSQGCMRWGPT